MVAQYHLERISKEIQDRLEPGFRLVISSAAKPLSIQILFQPTRIGAEAKRIERRRAWRSQQALIPPPEH